MGLAKTEKPGLVQLAVVAGAHGVRGALKLKTFTEAAGDVTSYGPLLDDQGGPLLDATIISNWRHGVIVQDRTITDRTTAEAMRGLGLFVPRQNLPETDDDEFYHTDLIGLQAVGADGSSIGRVTAIHDFGAGDLIEIKGGGDDILIPFTAQTVPEIDLDAGLIRVDPPVEVRT